MLGLRTVSSARCRDMERLGYGVYIIVKSIPAGMLFGVVRVGSVGGFHSDHLQIMSGLSRPSRKGDVAPSFRM